jgi:hypothetical protein
LNLAKNIRDTSEVTDGSSCVPDTGALLVGNARRAALGKTYMYIIIPMRDSGGNDCQTLQVFVSHATKPFMRFIGGIDERASGLLH